MPLMGLRTCKNFVASNVDDVHRMNANKTQTKPKQPMESSRLGKVPKYIDEIRKELKEEKEVIQALRKKEE